MSIADLPQEVIDQLNVLNLEKLKRFQFAVQIDGNLGGGYVSGLIAGFDRIRGLGDEVEIREVQEGGYPGKYRFPRKSKQNAITLTRGMTYSRSLFDWYREVAGWTKGKDDYRRNVSIIMLDRIEIAAGQIEYEAWRWNIYNAWPSGWRGPRFNSLSNDLAFESVTLQHSGISEANGLLSGKAGEIASIFN